MISGALKVAVTLLTMAMALAAYYVFYVPLDLAIVYATDLSLSPSPWDRSVVRLRTRLLSSCPRGPDFSPAGPLVFLLSGMNRESHDLVETKSIFRSFVRLGCDINAMNASGLRPIHAAILFRNPASLQLVLDLGADPDQKTGPSYRFGSRSANLDASSYLAKLCNNSDENCEELRTILATAKRKR